jgi:hypothetical protein
VAGISPSQFWSILMVGLGVGLIFIMNYIGKRFVPVAEGSAETTESEAEEEVQDEQ